MEKTKTNSSKKYDEGPKEKDKKINLFEKEKKEEMNFLWRWIDVTEARYDLCRV